MKCNHCYPACQCGAEDAVREGYRHKAEAFLRVRNPEVRAIEALLAAYGEAK
jgi:hypothetical protein